MSRLLEMRIAHQIDGRTRLVALGAVPAATLEAHAKNLAATASVRVDVRAGSGSIVIHHSQPWASLAGSLRSAGITVGQPAPSNPISQTTALLNSLNTGMSRATEGRMDLLNMAYVALIIGSLVQMYRGNWGGPVTTLLSQALTLALMQGTYVHSGASAESAAAPADVPLPEVV